MAGGGSGGHGGKGGRRIRSHRLSHKKAALAVVRNDINVTPLVDVMLVLLIIFMLMTLIMGRGQDVPLPKAKNFSEEKDKMQPRSRDAALSFSQRSTTDSAQRNGRCATHVHDL
jgi:biopolymer transport protein ExbD